MKIYFSIPLSKLAFSEINARSNITLPQLSTKVAFRKRSIIIFQLILLITLISVIVPLAPLMPSTSLDASWALGLNQAVAQGLAFGQDIIFTLGPYSSIYTKYYHPATDNMMIIGSLYLALSYWLGLYCLTQKRPWYWVIVLCILFCTMIYSRDSLLFSYPFLVGLIIYQIGSSDRFIKRDLSGKTNAFVEVTACADLSHQQPAACSRDPSMHVNPRNLRTYSGTSGKIEPLSSILLFILFAPFGLLALIKGSLLILITCISVLCTLLLVLSTREYRKASICLLSPILMIILCWSAAGQSLNYLLSYLTSTFSIASNFTEAMSLDGDPYEIILYLIGVCPLFVLIYLQKNISIHPRYFLYSLLFIFLFISFKTGFTRHFGHALIPSSSLLISAIFLTILLRSKLTAYVMLFALIPWGYSDGHYQNLSLHQHVLSTFAPAWHGLKSRILDRNALEKNYAIIMQYIHHQAPFPKLSGSTDLYSYRQALLIASGNHWQPRPIFQSYSVFSATLAQINQHSLQKKHAPDNIIFSIEPIDNRLPALEDGLSWRTLIHHYHISKFLHHQFLILKKNAPRHRARQSMTLKQDEKRAITEHHILGENIHLKSHHEPIFIEVNMQSSYWGTLKKIFYKSAPVMITLKLEDGRHDTYRIIPNMAKSGFILSPLIENTADFAALFENASFQLSHKKVESFKISAKNPAEWVRDFTITLKQMNNTLLL